MVYLVHFPIRHAARQPRFIPRIAASLLAAASVVPLVLYAQSCMPLPDTLVANIPLGLAEARLDACNRDVIAAQRAAEAAGADRIIAGQRPNPTLTLGTNNFNPKAGIGSGSLRDKAVDSSVRLDQLIERGNKGGLREQQADANIRAAGADYLDVLRLQRAALRTLYFDLAFQQVRRRLMREFADLSGESLRAAEKRFSAGDIAEIDLSRFRLDAAKAENDVRSADADLARVRADFVRSIAAEGAAARAGVQAALPDAATSAGELSVAAARIDTRPDLIAARQRVNAAEAASALARAIATRDVTLGAQFDRWPVTGSNTQGTGNSFGFTLSIPLFVRHANKGEATRASVDLQTARELANRIEVQAKSDVRITHDAWIAAIERLKRTERDVQPLAKKVADAAEFAYRKGAISVLELLDARRNFKLVALDAAQARADAGKAWAAFAAAINATPNEASGVTP